ncbi:MAG: efflux RND transporter permease subunit, partial [Spirochaetaceae bacterium]|nr:efflux RND transporter permease subunit [Spirochaetaceae bacterium]
EVLLSNTASMLTTNIVFLPVFMINGVVSELFADMAISIIAAITFSAVASFTLLPALFSIIDKKTFNTPTESPLLISLKKGYGRVLHKVFDFHLFAPTALLGCCLLGILIFTLLPKEFMERGKSKSVEIEIKFPANSSLEAMMKKCGFLYEKLNSPYLENINFECEFKKTDAGHLSDYAFRRENVRLYFNVVGKNSKDVLAMTEKIFREENLSHTVLEEKDFLSSLLDFPDFSVIVFGNDEKTSRSNALKCASDGVIIPDETSTNYVFNPNRIFMTRLNLDNSFSATTIRPLTEGIEITPFYENSVQIPMKVELAEKPENGNRLENFFAKVNEEISLPIKFLGDISTTTNENILYRFNQKDGRLISEKNFIPQTGVEFANLKKDNFDELLRDSAFLLVAVIAFLYLILAAQFESFLLPVLLLLAIPPAFFGAFAFLFISGKTVNVNVCIALIILFGTSVNNSILLYESCKNLVSRDKKQIICACMEKFRAIFVTNATSILALSPFAFNFTGNNTQSSLAISVMGGLITSTLIVLLIIPLLFSKNIGKKESR